MGCDIHFFTEKLEDSVWKTLDEWERRGRYIHCRQERYDRRNYLLFAILADVRSREAIEPLERPRGLPDNMSPELTEYADQWRGECHHCTYYALKELLDAPWDLECQREFYTDQEEIERFTRTGKFPPCCDYHPHGDINRTYIA